MNIRIITVYDSLNYGSFFQAFALFYKLKEYGNTAVVNVHHQNTFLQTIERIIKDLIRGRMQSARLEIDKYQRFSEAKKKFTVIDKKEIVNGDVLVFGSDEIWNISRRKIYRTKAFFGVGLPREKRIAIAPSINLASYEMLEKRAYIKNELELFDSISARDRHTKECIDQLCGVDVALVSDPTLLYDDTFYLKYEERTHEKNYIILYTYGTMINDDSISSIRNFAREKKLNIVSIGKWYSFCDSCIAPSVGEFVSYIKNASYIFTDTFHGTMFSLIFKKQFVSYAEKNTKVRETLEFLSLSNRIVCKTQNLENIIEHDIDYSIVSPRIKKYAESLEDYISNCFMSLREETK